MDRAMCAMRLAIPSPSRLVYAGLASDFSNTGRPTPLARASSPVHAMDRAAIEHRVKGAPIYVVHAELAVRVHLLNTRSASIGPRVSGAAEHAPDHSTAVACSRTAPSHR